MFYPNFYIKIEKALKMTPSFTFVLMFFLIIAKSQSNLDFKYFLGARILSPIKLNTAYFFE